VDADLLAVQAEVREDHAGAEVRLIAEDRVAHVAEVRDLDSIKQKAVLELARVAQHAARARDDATTDVGSGPDLRPGTDPRRTNEGRGVREDYPGLQVNLALKVHPGRHHRARPSGDGAQGRSDGGDPLPWCRILAEKRRKSRERFRKRKERARLHGNYPEAKTIRGHSASGICGSVTDGGGG